MDRSDRVSRADALLRRADVVLGRCLELAREGDPYFTGMRPSIHAWQEAMGAWRAGTAGQKRVILLADEMSRALETLERGFAHGCEERRVARAAEARAAAEEAARRDRVARVDAQRQIARLQAVDDVQTNHGPHTLFQQGSFDLRESGPG